MVDWDKKIAGRSASGVLVSRSAPDRMGTGENEGSSCIEAPDKSEVAGKIADAFPVTGVF